MATHTATFKWPNSHPSTVVVTGTFDNWSGNTHLLHKGEHGFEGQITGLKYETAYDYKYVIDGTWQIRDDEDKSWDASGNTNNVYRTPAAPAPAPVAPAPVAAAPVVADKHVESKAVDATPAPVSHDALLASSLPRPAASTAPSTMAVKDEPLVSTPPPSIAPAAASSSEPTAAQEIVNKAHHKDNVEAAHPSSTPAVTESKPIVAALDPIASTPAPASTAEAKPLAASLDPIASSPAPATMPASSSSLETKPMSRALDPIASVTTVDDAKHYLADSDTTLAGLAGAAAAVAAGLVHEAESMIFGHGATPVEKSAEKQTDALKEVDAVPVLPVAPTANYINQDSAKAADESNVGHATDKSVNSLTTKSADPLAELNLGKPLTSASESSVPALKTVATPVSALADPSVVVVPEEFSAKQIAQTQKEEKIAVAPIEHAAPAATSTPTSTSTPTAAPVASQYPAPIPGSGEPIPASVPAKDDTLSPSNTAHSEARDPHGGSLTSPLVNNNAPTEADVKNPSSNPAAAARSGYATPPAVAETPKPATAATAVPASTSTPVVSPPTAESTPAAKAGAVPGSYPNVGSVDSTPAGTPSKLSTRSSKLASEDDKHVKRKSSIFGKIGSMFGKKDKQ